MALFEYKGVENSGKAAKGVIEADSPKTARTRLKDRGIYTTYIKQKKSGSKSNASDGAKAFSLSKGVSLKAMTAMNRQLATLIKARIPLDEALTALIEQTDDPKLKSVLSQVKESVTQGHSLAKSCGQFPKVFDEMFVSMIQVGEVSGNLDLVLSRLADFAENQYMLKNKVLAAMTYPVLMGLGGGAIIIFLFAFAVPKITEVFAGSDMALPAITVAMIAISEFMSQQWLSIVLFFVGGFFLFKWYTSTPKGRAHWDGISLKIPLFGKLRRMVAVSRFARTMATLIGSGVQLLEAIDIVKDVVGNAVIRAALIRSKESIREGKSIAGPMRASGQFPSVLTHMIAVGEKTGELEQMLTVVADSFDNQVDAAINAMTRLLEPLMIIIMGVIIGLVAVSIFLPMLQLNNLSAL